MAGDFTLIQLLAALGFATDDKHLNWELGAALRERFRQDHAGRLPRKVLHEKTGGQGSHCFATYPGSFRDCAPAIVLERFAREARQLDLFVVYVLCESTASTNDSCELAS